MDAGERCQWTWLHRGIGLGMRIPSARTGHRVWVVVYPLPADRPARDGGTQVYCVRRLEAQRMNLGQILQMTDGAVTCLEEFFAYGDQHLTERLEQRGLSIGTFYPLAAAAASEEHGVRPLRPTAS